MKSECPLERRPSLRVEIRCGYERIPMGQIRLLAPRGKAASRTFRSSPGRSPQRGTEANPAHRSLVKQPIEIPARPAARSTKLPANSMDLTSFLRTHVQRLRIDLWRREGRRICQEQVPYHNETQGRSECERKREVAAETGVNPVEKGSLQETKNPEEAGGKMAALLGNAPAFYKELCMSCQQGRQQSEHS